MTKINSIVTKGIQTELNTHYSIGIVHMTVLRLSTGLGVASISIAVSKSVGVTIART